jgi:autotransporter-associated beta strand protein
VALAAAGVLASSASADTFRWTRAASNNNWDGSSGGVTNWTNLDGPTATQPPADPLPDGAVTDILFSGPVTVFGTTTTLRKSYTVNSITFNSDFVYQAAGGTSSFGISTLSSGTVAADLTLGAGGFTVHDIGQNINVNHTQVPGPTGISAKLTLAADQTWDVDIPPTPTGSGKTFGVFRPLYGSATLTKTGAGILILSKNNGNFTGDIVLDQGTIRTGGDASSPNGHFGTGTVINESADNVSITSSTVSNDDEGSPGGGADRTFSNDFRLGGTGQITFGGSFNINLGAASTVTLTSDKHIAFGNNGPTNTYTWDAKVTGAHGFSKIGGATLILTNTANDYTGVTTFSGGTVQVSDAHQLGDSSATNNLAFDGGTLKLTAPISTARSITSLNGGTIDTGANDATISGGMTAGGSGVLHKAGAGTLTLANVRAGGLAVDAGKVVVPANGTDAGVSKVGSLAIAPNATLDLNDNDLILDYDPAAPAIPADTVRQLLKAGRDGAWTGPGIVSTTAKANAQATTGIAYAEASDVLGLSGSATATWGGQTADASSLLLKYTYYGDANLDGVVNRDDFALVDRGAAKGLAGWLNGDFDYDGVSCAAPDYALMDKAFLLNGGALSPSDLADRAARFGDAYVSGLIASVPEPASLATCALALIPATCRRRRPH